MAEGEEIANVSTNVNVNAKNVNAKNMDAFVNATAKVNVFVSAFENVNAPVNVLGNANANVNTNEWGMEVAPEQ